MGVHFLKYRDTGPPLQVGLLNPDKTPFDLTGYTVFKLHIWLSTGTTYTTKLARDMTKVGADTAGVLQYDWVVTDWDAGQLIVGPQLPLAPGQVEHRVEYEVTKPGGARRTFPNNSYDTLRITTDIGQG